MSWPTFEIMFVDHLRAIDEATQTRDGSRDQNIHLPVNFAGGELPLFFDLC